MIYASPPTFLLCLSLPGPALPPVTAAWPSCPCPAAAPAVWPYSAPLAAAIGHYCRGYHDHRSLRVSLHLSDASPPASSRSPRPPTLPRRLAPCWSTPRARYSGSALSPASLNASRLPLSRPLNLTHPSRTTRCHGGMVVSQVKDQDRGMMLRI
uniref:Secreted protein n=1 Tax=Branchiostoma floridae TaxID=7739 RepID=C3XZW0_BRAFL|eukprot:XP_002610316.1 hypothetical protein BRAFLDRAFT_123723 [Branchiostoma floridae]